MAHAQAHDDDNDNGMDNSSNDTSSSSSTVSSSGVSQQSLDLVECLALNGARIDAQVEPTACGVSARLMLSSSFTAATLALHTPDHC